MKRARSIPPRRAWVCTCTMLALGLTGCATLPASSSPPLAALTKSAHQGNLIAADEYGNELLAKARSTSSRLAAIQWIRKAAVGNLALAQDQLGNMYLHGKVVPQSTALALKWTERSADRGAPAAQLQLAGLYRAGVLVPVNLEKTYYWYLIASEGRDGDVHILNIEAVKASARKDAQRMSLMLAPAQRAAVKARVAAWKPLPSVPYVSVVNHLATIAQ